MTSLDDALSSASPIFDTPFLYVAWKETPEGEQSGHENVRNLSDVLSGQYTVEHSLDDGLPDSVTMTSSGDAGGKLSAGVVGRPGLTYDGWSVPASSSGTIAGPANNFTPSSLPSSPSWGNYLFLFITVPSLTANLSQGAWEGTPQAWKLVGKKSATTVTTWVYSWKVVGTLTAPKFYMTETLANLSYVYAGVRSTDPSGNELSWRINAQVAASAVGSATAHTQPSITTTSARSVMFAVWSSPGSATWTLTSPDTSLAAVASGSETAMLVARAGLYSTEQVRNNFIATRSVASADVAMMVFALEPFERPNMEPTEFWSPFHQDSPIYGFERDTADVSLDFWTVTDDGTQATTLFTGQMDSVSLGSGGDVVLEGSSQVRITLNKSVNLPQVYARREQTTVDWMLAWLLARGDRFVGPAPGPYTRWWIPMYGSVHAALGAESKGYNAVLYYDSSGGPYGQHYPDVVEGPFHLAMWATHSQFYTREIVLNGIDLYKSREIWPWVTESYDPATLFRDLMSFSNAAGRLSFWIKGDATYNGTPSGVPSSSRYLWSYTLEARNRGNTVMSQVFFCIDTDRQMYAKIMSGNGASSTVVSWGSPIALPSDDQWHFYAVSWDYLAGTVKIQHNGSSVSSSIFATNGNNSTNEWVYNTDEELYRLRGGKINNVLKSHLPISDITLETGPQVFASNSDIWPSSQWPSFTVTTRPTDTPLEGIFNDEPVNAWATVAELARSTMSMYRANELDNVEFLPPSYFGEATQMTASYTVDTDTNAQPFQIEADPAKSRNVVTVKYTEQAVDIYYSSCLSLTTSYDIPPGVTDITFTLDSPVAEIHGAADPYGTYWTLTNLTAANITTGWAATPTDYPFMTVNTAADGSGTVLPATSVGAVIVGNTATTATVRFTNRTNGTVYLANNNQANDGIPQLPSLRLLGYVVNSADGYVTQRDAGTISSRRERATDTEIPWISYRETATRLAGWLVSTVSRPRAEITAVVQGDPRRVPGELVNLGDSFKTHASGTWRVLSVAHNADGAEFTQTVRMVEVLPIGAWDLSTWDNVVWGE